jgi:sugar phosphate permease
MIIAAAAWLIVIRNKDKPIQANSKKHIQPHTQPLNHKPPQQTDVAQAPPQPGDAHMPRIKRLLQSVMNRIKSFRASAVSAYSGFFKFAVRNGLIFMGAICLLHGVVKEAIVVWGPMLLSETYAVPYQHVTEYYSIIPLINFLAILLTGFIVQKIRGQIKRGIFILLLLAAAICCVMASTLGIGIYASLALLAGISASLFIVNILLLTFTPMEYSADNRVSGVAGFLDFTVYSGAALAAPLFGRLSAGGWRAVVFTWMGICVAAVFILISVTGFIRKKMA